jgi:hypothetical protein
LNQLDTNTFTADITIPDKIIHAGDTNTAIRFPAADTVTVETAGAERLRVDSSGNVGIGTSSPNADLELGGAGEVIRLSGSSTNAYIRSTDGTTNQWYIGSGGAAGLQHYIYQAQPMTFHTNGTERMRIDSSGNLGLGVTPSASSGSAKVFEVGSAGNTIRSGVNDVYLTSNAYFNTGWKYGSTGSAASYYNQTAGTHQWHTAPSGTAGDAITFTQAMTLDASGKLSVGTTGAFGILNLKEGAVSLEANTDATSANWLAYNRGSSAYATLGLRAADVRFLISDTERARIDSSGNVIIGGGSIPISGKLQLQKYDVTGGDYLAFVNRGTNASHTNVYDIGGIFASGFRDVSDPAYIAGITFERGATNGGLSSSGAIVFKTDNIGASTKAGVPERARIDSLGNLLVGTTSWATGQNAFRVNNFGRVDITRDTTAAADQIYFANPNGVVGAITTSGSATAYNTSSDYRLKENVQPMQDALAVIAQLNPVTYTWKADGSDGQGFIAHELQAVVPDCVTGEKDAVDAEGNPQYQGVDTSFLVATLVKAVQELTAKVASLEAQLNP